MNNRYQNRLLGYYLPAFFFIDIATEDKLENLDLLTDENKSTLYHEYVHFLQDLTTTFGLTNIVNSVDIQKAINVKIRNSGKSTFITPISFESFYDVETYSNLNEMYLGDTQSDFSNMSIITSIEFHENGIIPDFEDQPYVEITYITNGLKSSLMLGAIAVMENMAYLIESSLYDNVNPPIYPYRIVERIIEFEYPEFDRDKINLVLICDFALNTPDPGRFLLEFIRLLKAQGVTHYKDFYNILKKYKFSSLDGNNYTVFSLFEKRSELAQKQLEDYFTIEIYNDINKWISILLDSTSKFKLENFNFWINILSPPTKEKRRNEFNRIIAKFGYPLLSNNNQEISFYHPQVIPKYVVAFKAINEVREVMMNRQGECELQTFCKHGKTDITNKNCQTPWERGKEDPLCPFGQIIKMWGIHEITPDNG